MKFYAATKKKNIELKLAGNNRWEGSSRICSKEGRVDFDNIEVIITTKTKQRRGGNQITTATVTFSLG